MTYPKTKIEIVKTILAETRDDPDFPWNNHEPDKLIFEWFVTGRRGNGLRLTDVGASAFTKANIAHYTFDLKQELSNTVSPTGANWESYVMLLNKKIHCPYYIGATIDEKKKKKPYIRIYDHKVAMLMTLYGTVDDYLESVK
jgi:hypothetical protein